MVEGAEVDLEDEVVEVMVDEVTVAVSPSENQFVNGEENVVMRWDEQQNDTSPQCRVTGQHTTDVEEQTCNNPDENASLFC